MPQERLPRKAYLMMLRLAENGKKSWAFYVKNLLCEHGFVEVWQQQGVGDFSSFLHLLKERLINRFQGEWSDIVLNNDRFEFYALFKRTWQAEKYVDYEQLRCFRLAYVQFRFGISPINTHRLRYRKNISSRHLLCPSCKQEMEDEAHVMLQCKVYDDLRKGLEILNHYYFSDVSEIMSFDDKKTVCDISKFLYYVFKKRNEFLQF